MREIEITATVGERRLAVRITDPHPRGEYWDVYIDHYYHGRLIFRCGRWEGHFRHSDLVQGDDIRVLSDIIEEVYPEK